MILMQHENASLTHNAHAEQSKPKPFTAADSSAQHPNPAAAAAAAAKTARAAALSAVHCSMRAQPLFNCVICIIPSVACMLQCTQQ
jgi:hypothetical protein